MGTDHVVTSMNEKLVKGDVSDRPGDPKTDVWSAGSGMVGLETALPVMLSEGVHKGRITFEKLVEIYCQNTAYTFGLYPKKGTIQVGSDGDLVIIDMKKTMKVSEKILHSYADFTVFEGLEVKGWPILTVLGGNVIMEDREPVGKHGQGRYIPRKVGSQLYPLEKTQ